MEAPTLAPLPEELPLPVRTPEGTLLPPELADAVHRYMAEAELLPAAAERALEAQRKRDDARLREVVEVMESETERRIAEAVRDAGGVSMWTAVLWGVGAAVAFFSAGLVAGFVAADSPGVVVAR